MYKRQGNGYSLYNEIKSYKDIPIVFLTANQDEFSVVTGLNLGADDYISKPFRPRELLSRIQNILRRYHKQETFYQYQNIKVNPLTLDYFGTICQELEERTVVWCGNR